MEGLFGRKVCPSLPRKAPVHRCCLSVCSARLCRETDLQRRRRGHSKESKNRIATAHRHLSDTPHMLPHRGGAGPTCSCVRLTPPLWCVPRSLSMRPCPSTSSSSPCSARMAPSCSPTPRGRRRATSRSAPLPLPSSRKPPPLKQRRAFVFPLEPPPPPDVSVPCAAGSYEPHHQDGRVRHQARLRL